jgi:CRISPR/Cas system-associated exonuclease Cas4 (RecB family)
MKNELHIYPTSRAIREEQTRYKQHNGFIPTFMRMDEFINSIAIVENLSKVDMIDRILYLQEASNFDDFDKLKLDRTLVKFFTKSDAIFKFFEELSVEGVSFDTLRDADAYVEFEEHIGVLESLYNRYQEILLEANLTDRAFIPSSYQLNRVFIESFDEIVVYIYGYPSQFEWDLLSSVSKLRELIIHIETTPFNKKVQDTISKRFGISLRENRNYKISLSSGEILEDVESISSSRVSLFQVEQRLAQIPLALMEIEKMIASGILADEIVILLPDESAKEYFKLFDRERNLNFAMGDSFIYTREYKLVDLLYRAILSRDDDVFDELLLYGVKSDFIDDVDSSYLSIELFFEFIDNLVGMSSSIQNSRFLEYKESFIQIFRNREFKLTEWLFLWAKKLSGMSIDDVRGGRVTAMGVLESRGMSYKGIVIVDFNDNIVPATSSKDQFLNTQVREFANLPTTQDREALQKHYYHSIIKQAKEVSIIYATSNNRLPSKFLYEMGLSNAKSVEVDSSMFYRGESSFILDKEIEAIPFDATSMSWSASRLKVFLECKRKFYYKYIESIKSKPSKELNTGAILHRVLHKVFESNPTYDDRKKLSKDISLELDRVLGRDNLSLYYKTLFLAKLESFIDAQIEHFKMGYRVIEREYHISGDIAGIKFNGVVDRIDESSDSVLVIDYKTGLIIEANRVKNLEKLTDFQMSIYHILLSKQFSSLELAFLPLFKDGDFVEVKALEDKNSMLLERLLELKAQKSLEPTKCDDLSTCNYCDYILLCGRGEYL